MDKAAELLHDKNQGVALAGVTLMLHSHVTLEPAAVERYRAHVPVSVQDVAQLVAGEMQLFSIGTLGHLSISPGPRQ